MNTFKFSAAFAACLSVVACDPAEEAPTETRELELTTVVDVEVAPTFIRNETAYSAGDVSYDPTTAVLTYEWDLATEQRRLVFPARVDGEDLEVLLIDAPPGGQIELGDGTIALPALYHDEECITDLTFYQPATPAAPKLPKFKITTTIRGRPQGG